MPNPPLISLPDGANGGDLVKVEQAIAQAIADLMATVEGIGQVHIRPRYPESDEEDITLSTVPDPVVGPDSPFTNVIEVGIPSVAVMPYTDDAHVRVSFTYPFTFDLGVKDRWAKEGLPFASSAEMFIGLYLRATQKFANNRTLGYIKVEHDHLQQINAGDVNNEEGEAQWHAADWTLTVNCTSVKV